MATRVGSDPIERCEVVVGGQTVVRICSAPHAMIGALELAAVGGAATEVDGGSDAVYALRPGSQVKKRVTSAFWDGGCL